MEPALTNNRYICNCQTTAKKGFLVLVVPTHCNRGEKFLQSTECTLPSQTFAISATITQQQKKCVMGVGGAQTSQVSSDTRESPAFDSGLTDTHKCGTISWLSLNALSLTARVAAAAVPFTRRAADD